MTIKSIVAPFMLEQIAVFNGLDARGYERLAAITRRRRYAIAEMVVWIGDAPNEVYFIREGEVEVIIPGEGFVRLKPGDAFGETALIEDGEFLSAEKRTKRRNASCVTRSPVDLIYIFADDLGALLGEYPAVKAQFVALAEQRERHS
ncbi:MAG: cyclic nucleotide-binding domain-containing protein [Myxococcales bacterium]|nr:cyclic nucleotide-binding domain-containing protein [Myxococcales bacterium]